jgi:UDP-N-acetylmuramoylalanine--D-glutamate ligase
VLDLTGRIAILGLGRSGEAVVDWALARPGHGPEDVAVFVEHDTPASRTAADAVRRRGVEVSLGVSGIGGGAFALIVASPGIAPRRPLMVDALAALAPVISELELAFQVAAAPFVAVTGTNGKTTTTALLEHLLRAGGVEARAAGNIGRPALEVARETPQGGVIVAECSSFQLALTLDFHPRVAILLNVTPDHLDWHGSMEEYAAAKLRVFANQEEGDTAIVDADDPGASAAIARGAVGRGRLLRVTAGAGGDARLDDGTLVVDAGAGPDRLVRADEMQIRGAHNVANALAASAAALALGVGAEAVRGGLRSFAPIEHRLEPVATIDGVLYVNDSKATNPDAVLKALTAFDGRRLLVLLGGRNKGNDFRELARACGVRCGICVLYGEARDELEAAFESEGAPFALAQTMADAVEVAVAAAAPGDVVLLSPACASFDEFADFEDRGRRFTAAIRFRHGGRR